MSQEKRGRIHAVCTSEVHGYPKYPQDRIMVYELGIDGDAHSGPLRNSFRQPGTLKQNDRPISLVSREVMQEMNATLNLEMKPGDFNENIMVEGLGDLGDILVGALLFFSGGVVLEVTDQCYPCERLEKYNGPGLNQALVSRTAAGIYNRRGIVAKVLQTGELFPGEVISVQRRKS
jgi:MOSC domain-containing protein YiiM